MEIHNLMEELVLKMVQDLCDEEEKKPGSIYCTSEQCRVDVACFVLNRIPQYYVSSARGIAHSERAFKENPQLVVDLVTLVHEGMKRVSHIQRPYYATPESGRIPQGPAFIFPTIKGRFLSCHHLRTYSGRGDIAPSRGRPRDHGRSEMAESLHPRSEDRRLLSLSPASPVGGTGRPFTDL